MLTIEIFFLLYLPFVGGARYYAFVETLFVIDQKYFPHLSHTSYEDYVRTIVDTSNIVNQTEFYFPLIYSIVDISNTK